MMIEVVFLAIALVVGSPQGPDAASQLIAQPDMATCQKNIKVAQALTDAKTSVSATCITFSFPEALFKKGVEINATGITS